MTKRIELDRTRCATDCVRVHRLCKSLPGINRNARRLFLCLVLVSLSTAVLSAQANHIVISEVYGGGGNNGSTWKNDFVELYNPTNAPVDMSGWSVQYASKTGSFVQNITPLIGVIQPKSYYLIQEAAGTNAAPDLPAPDALGTIAMAQSDGKVALARTSAAVSGPTDPTVVDFVGYGVVNASEGSPAPAISNTTSAERKASANSTAATLAPGGSEEKAGNGYDSDNNANDFVAQMVINPQNSASSKEPPPAIQAGVGVALFLKSAVKADSSMQVTLVVKGVSSAVITSVQFPKYPLFDWSHISFNVNSSGTGQALVRQTTDSVGIVGLSLSATDSVQLQISGLSAPDTTLKVTFRVETGAGSDSTALVTPLPSFVLCGNPRPIAVTKVNDTQGVPLNLQMPVTVHGIVTVANQLGGPAYVQDISGGLAVFDLAFENSVKIGDEVTLTGTVTQYNGLTELANVVASKIHSSGNEIVPTVVTCSQVAHDGVNGVEVYEGMLVQLNGVSVRDASGLPIATWTVSGSGANFWLHDNDSVQVRIDGDVQSIANSPAPGGTFDIIGVVGQFIATPPFAGGYQLMPRFIADVLSKGPILTVAPLETSITPGSFDVGWETARAGSSVVRYGSTKAYELGTVSSATLLTAHRLTVSGLKAATAYHIQVFSVSGSDTSFGGDRVVSTASQGSTGQVNVYFNKSVNAGLARGVAANGNAVLTDLLIRRINAAQKSIDCAVYSFSGQVGQTIANALVQARTRGVEIRFIIEHDNMSASSGYVINQTLLPAGIPCIEDNFDQANAGVGLQHNKFFIFDYRGAAPDQTWVWTGSWNPTDPGTNDDCQNSIEIQDQALAGAYTTEFNEMWGSDTVVPDAANSRFGARKLDNTPHIFNINGMPVELYFSPSDRTTSHIVSTLAKAQNSINVALLTLTRSDIAATMKLKKDAGLKVRGVLDNGTDTGSQYTFLTSGGVDIRLKGNTVGLLHHKYGVIDAEVSTATQYVITGSHNWTSAAETSNNENALIIQSNSIANQYLQEFAARYKDANGLDNILVSVDKTTSGVPTKFSLYQNYPNPFNPSTTIRFDLAESGPVTLRVIDVLGRQVAMLLNEARPPGSYTLHWNAAGLPSGVYFYELREESFVAVRPMLLLK